MKDNKNKELESKNSSTQSNELNDDGIDNVAGGMEPAICYSSFLPRRRRSGERGKGWRNGFYDEKMIKSYMEELKLPRNKAIDQLEADYLEAVKYGWKGWQPNNI